MSMPRELEDQNESSFKKIKTESSEPEVVVIEESSSSVNQDLLRCPVCGQFPRKEVYQCNTGHSICSTCLTKLRKCSICGCLYKKVRNYVAEGLLDSMKFECSWKEFGCSVTQMERKDLPSHESQCVFNPNSINFCRMFGKLSCTNKFCPVSTQDPAEMNNFLDHLIFKHDFTIRDVKLRESFTIHLKNGSLFCFDDCDGREEPWLCKTILRLKSTKTNPGQGREQLFMVLWRFDWEGVFLFKVVRLDDSRGEMTISLCLTGPVVAPPEPQLPELNWDVKPQGIRELNFFWEQTNDLSSYHMIPTVFLENYETKEGFPIEFNFT